MITLQNIRVMEKQIKTFYDTILQNIRKIMKDRDISQSRIALKAGMQASQVSKILSGDQRMSIDSLSKFARAFSMSEIDIITYPVKYLPVDKVTKEPVKAVLQIELSKEKRDQVFKLVFGEGCSEILKE